MTCGERNHGGRAQQLVHRWQFAKKFGFCGDLHFRIYPFDDPTKTHKSRALRELHLQGMQIRQQVLNILRTQRLAIARHFVAAESDDVGDALVIGGQSAQRKIFMLENSFKPRAFFAVEWNRLMAAVAVGIVNFASSGLLRIQAKFGIRLAALDIATKENAKQNN